MTYLGDLGGLKSTYKVGVASPLNLQVDPTRMSGCVLALRLKSCRLCVKKVA